MARRVLLLALVLLALTPVGAPATASTSGGAGDVSALDAEIERAERHVHRWYRRIERWYMRIDRASERVERLEASAASAEAAGSDEVRRTRPRTSVPGFRLLRAARSLHRILTDPRARHVQAELDTWTAFLAELAHARERAARPEPADERGGASGGGGPIVRGPLTYEAWASAFLDRLGAPSCTENLVIVVTWETAESTSAAFNPLATTRDMPGATDMNTVGVKDYVSLRQGLDASRDTLLMGAESYGYGAILEGLRRCGPAEATARAINASAWCRGCVGGAYITGLLPIVRASYDEHAERSISRG